MLRAAVVLPLALLAAACGREVSEARRDAELPPEPPAAAPAAPPAVTNYTCANGQRLEARYPDPQTAVVAYGGRTFTLQRTPSETGALYAGEGRQWRSETSGGPSDEGTLRFIQPDSPVAGELIAECSTAGGGAVG